MMPDGTNPLLQNQSLVRFNTSGTEQVSYSNTVVTPLVGPILTVTKSSVETEASLGQSITYRIVMTNTGNKDAQVTVFDTIPEGTSLIANSVLLNGIPLPGVSPGSGIPAGTLQVNGTITIVFQVIVVSIPADLQLSNQAVARYSFQADDDRVVTGSEPSNVITIPVKPFFVSARLSASTNTTFVGDIVTYETFIVNEGNTAIINIIMKMPVPPGMQFIQGSVVINDMIAPTLNPEIGIPVATVAPGASVKISFRMQVVQIPPSESFFSQATVSYTVGGGSYSLETNTVTIQAYAAGLQVVTSVNYDRATVSDTLKYTIVVRNNGTLAVDAELEITIPDNTLFVWNSIYINGVLQRGAQPSDRLPLGTLTAGSQSVVTYEVQIPSTVTIQKPLITNLAEAYYTFRLPDGRLIQLTDDSNTVVTELVVPILQLHAEADPSVVEIGCTTECKVVTVNVGNWPAGVVLSELIPANTSYVAGSLRWSGVSGGLVMINGTVSLGIIHPNQEVTICYKILVKEDDASHRIHRYMVAAYRYELDGRSYSGEVRSNTITIIIEDYDE